MAESVWIAAPGVVAVREEALPAVGPGDVHVRALVSGISHGTEMLVYRGQAPPDLPLDLPTLQGSFRFPIKYGYASVGRVAAVGPGVEDLRPGDLVFVHHPHQTEYVVPSALPVRLPPDLPAEAGVFVANLETAVNVLLDAGPRLGERVLVFGQGVVGLLLTSLFRRAGAALVMVVDPIPRRRALAREMGADVTLAPDEGVAEAVYHLTEGGGADVVVEASGNPEALRQALPCAAFQGTVVVASWYGTKPVTLDLGDAFHRRRLRLVGSQVSTVDPSLQPRWSRSRRLRLAVDLLRQLPLVGLVTHRVPFRRAAEAYALVDRRPQEVVQVVLTYGASDV